MIIKKVKDRKKRGVEATAAYIADARHATEGQPFGPKVEFAGTLNTVSEDWQGATAEISALCGSYKGESDATSAHWIASLQEGERFTQETAEDTVKTVLKSLGMEGHPCTWTVHNDKKNHHIHMNFSRVAPEPGPDGDFHIVWKGAVIQAEKGNNEILSGHVAVAELCHRHGWTPEANARFSWENGNHVQNKRQDTNPDKINMGQRVEAWEARAGVKHPKRIMAETALAVIRTANNDKGAAVTALAVQGIIYSDVNYLDAKGRRHCGGKLTGVGGEEVKISALPKDCRWIAKQPAVKDQPPVDLKKGTQIYTKIVTFGAAKKYIKQIVAEAKSGTEMFQKLEEKGLIFEQTGKAGGRIRFGKQVSDVIKLSECGTSFSQLQQKFNDFPPYMEKLHETQGKVNGNSGRDATSGGKDATNIHESSIKTLARAIFTEAETTGQMQKMLEKEGITFTREVATDQKTGRQFEYGKLARNGEAITLKSLGIRENGKAEFTLQSIDRVFLARDAAAIVSTASNWKEAETSLANDGIKYARVKTTTQDGKELIVGRLERGGITSSIGLAGKDFAPAILDSKFMPYSTAKALYEQARVQSNPVVFLAKQGLTASDIDRIGRVGEKLEPTLKKQDKQHKAHGTQAPASRPESSIIPRNINEILNLIEESARNAAALAAANAKAGQEAWKAREAENRAQAAEKALSELKASIKTETPAPREAAKEKTMADTTSPTPQAGGSMEKERERIQNSEKTMQERERELEKEKQRMQRERDRARQRQ